MYDVVCNRLGWTTCTREQHAHVALQRGCVNPLWFCHGRYSTPCRPARIMLNEWYSNTVSPGYHAIDGGKYHLQGGWICWFVHLVHFTMPWFICSCPHSCVSAWHVHGQHWRAVKLLHVSVHNCHLTHHTSPTWICGTKNTSLSEGVFWPVSMLSQTCFRLCMYIVDAQMKTRVSSNQHTLYEWLMKTAGYCSQNFMTHMTGWTPFSSERSKTLGVYCKRQMAVRIAFKLGPPVETEACVMSNMLSFVPNWNWSQAVWEQHHGMYTGGNIRASDWITVAWNNIVVANCMSHILQQRRTCSRNWHTVMEGAHIAMDKRQAAFIHLYVLQMNTAMWLSVM